MKEIYIIHEIDWGDSIPPVVYLATSETDAQEIILSIYQEEILDSFNLADDYDRQWILENWERYTKEYRETFIYEEIGIY